MLSQYNIDEIKKIVVKRGIRIGIGVTNLYTKVLSRIPLSEGGTSLVISPRNIKVYDSLKYTNSISKNICKHNITRRGGIVIMVKYNINEIKALANNVYEKINTDRYYAVLTTSATHSNKSSKLILFGTNIIRIFEKNFVKCLNENFEFRRIRDLSPRRRIQDD